MITSFGMLTGVAITSQEIVKSWKTITNWSGQGLNKNPMDNKDFNREFECVREEPDNPVRSHPWSNGSGKYCS